MSDYSVGIVGTGPHPDESDHDGYSMGYRHANGYRSVDNCSLGACVDVVPEHTRDFGEEYGLSDERTFTDLEKMLDAVEPDIVSVCTPPSTHADLVVDCARHDSVRAVHCEKPMAKTFGESKRMVEVCEENNTQLTINLQNRCSDAASEIKEVINSGEIGNLERIELARHDLLQTGLHHIDLANYVVGDEEVDWIIGQVDYPEERIWYTDMHAEIQSLGMWQYESGVHALCSTGEGTDAVGRRTNRFFGTGGEIEYQLFDEYRIRRYDSDDWETIEVESTPAQDNAMAIVVNSLANGDEPIISGKNALDAAEIVFGIWESARRRGRVNTPLSIEDNPLESLVESGELPPDR